MLTEFQHLVSFLQSLSIDKCNIDIALLSDGPVMIDGFLTRIRPERLCGKRWLAWKGVWTRINNSGNIIITATLVWLSSTWTGSKQSENRAGHTDREQTHNHNNNLEF